MLNSVRKILARYSKWLGAILAPLGIWGVFVIAAVDGSFLGLPLDAIVASYVYQDHQRFPLYAIMASAGSALGSSVLYLIGYAGGEALLRKRLSQHRFEKIHRSFDQHEFWALMFPAMLPPPTPFKLFVLAAAGFEMSYGRFLLAIFLGRFARFLLLSLLTIKYGRDVVDLVGQLFHAHLQLVSGILAAAIAAWLLLRQRHRKTAENN